MARPKGRPNLLHVAPISFYQLLSFVWRTLGLLLT
jgi:hypothetical protein